MKSIRAKIFIFLFIPAIVGMVSYFLIAELLLKKYFLEEQRHEALMNVERLTNSIKDAITGQKVEQIAQEIFDEKASGPHVEYVAVFDENGQVLAHTFLSDLPEQIFNPEHMAEKVRVYEQTINQKNILSVDNPVTIGIRKVGVIKVGYNNQEAREKYILVLSSYFALGFLLLVLAALSSLRLSKLIIAPVERLTAVTAQFSKGEFGKRSDVLTDDEIGRLSLVFNEMADNLEENKKIIEADQDASRRRIEELEVWQKNTVGRELKMIELKGQIKKLEAEKEELAKKSLNNNK